MENWEETEISRINQGSREQELIVHSNTASLIIKYVTTKPQNFSTPGDFLTFGLIKNLEKDVDYGCLDIGFTGKTSLKFLQKFILSVIEKAIANN